jgi:hypothetical protein
MPIAASSSRKAYRKKFVLARMPAFLGLSKIKKVKNVELATFLLDKTLYRTCIRTYMKEQQFEANKYEYTNVATPKPLKQEIRFIAAKMETTMVNTAVRLIEFGMEEYKCQQSSEQA